MKKKFIFYSTVIVFFLITCTKTKGPVPDTTVTAVGACDTGNWYNGKIETLILANCASASGCHGAGGSGIDYTTYAGVKYDIDNGSFNDRVFVIKDMPKGGVLTAAQLDRINCWLSKGAPETGSDSPVVVVPVTGCNTTISYASDISSIISTNCNTSSGCHGSGSIYGDYTSYSGLSTSVTNNTLNNRVLVIKDMAMFPYLATPLTSTDLSKIDCWIKQGGLNN